MELCLTPKMSNSSFESDSFPSESYFDFPTHLSSSDMEAVEMLVNLKFRCNICKKNLNYDCQPRKLDIIHTSLDGAHKIRVRTCNACGIRCKLNRQFW